MTKADIIRDIAEKTGVEKLAVQASVEAFMKSIKSAMENGQNVLNQGILKRKSLVI